MVTPDRARHATVAIDLPVPVERAWALLADTPRMVELDPLLLAYEPEGGTMAEGGLNRVTSRLGPLRVRLTTRTEVFDPPGRAMFASVAPSRPVHVSADDRLDPTPTGCRYSVSFVVTPTVPVVGDLAATVVLRRLVSTRRRLMARLREELTLHR
jgi:hypothetical protein